MKKPDTHHLGSWTHIGCLGNFRIEDLICRRHCALRIRCAIERDQEAYLEVDEEMNSGDDQLFMFQ